MAPSVSVTIRDLQVELYTCLYSFGVVESMSVPTVLYVWMDVAQPKCRYVLLRMRTKASLRSIRAAACRASRASATAMGLPIASTSSPTPQLRLRCSSRRSRMIHSTLVAGLRVGSSTGSEQPVAHAAPVDDPPFAADSELSAQAAGVAVERACGTDHGVSPHGPQ